MVRELEENVMINFMKRFAEHPFQIMMDGKEFNIGEGAPEFTVRIKHPIPLTNLPCTPLREPETCWMQDL